MTPYYSDDLVTIYHGDCRAVIPEIAGGVSVIVADPPYGIAWDVDPNGTRSPARRRGQNRKPSVFGDDAPFAPDHLTSLDLPTVIFGANHFADRLPSSPSWLVWDKRGRNGYVTDQADCEMAWTNLGGPARVYRQVWGGGGVYTRENGRPAGWHPNQKPVGLLRWVIGRCPPGTVLDPYTGSGSTLVAAKSLGRKSIGIEIDEAYCEIAAQRCSQEVLGLVG